jgi:hypothetical protein
MTSKFEQLIEYVINDEEAKAQELFHNIVVEKSREIYENLMNEEDEEELDEAAEEDCAEEELEEGMDSIGGDASDDLISDVEAEEQGMQEEEESDAEFDDEAEEDGEDLTHDMEAGHDEGSVEDRVVDLEDKLDELMAEFEALMGGNDDGIESDLDGEMGDEVEGDAFAQDDTQEFAPEMMEEGIELTKVAPAKMGDDGANNKSVVAFNSGATGMAGSPVKMTGDTAKGRPAPTAGSISSDKFQNTPASGSKKLSPAPKPVTSQAAGVNTKTPFPKG